MRRSFINEIGLVKGDAGRSRAVSGSLGCLRAESFARRDLRRLVIQSRRLFATVQSILSSRRSPILRESLLFAPRYTFVDVTNAITPTCYLRCLYITFRTIVHPFIAPPSTQFVYFSATKYKFVRSVFLRSFSLPFLKLCTV